jgi:hypothetical protein
VKRTDLERHLRAHDCQIVREGGRHTIWENPANDARAPIGRHREIPNTTCRSLCRQLGVPRP